MFNVQKNYDYEEGLKLLKVFCDLNPFIPLPKFIYVDPSHRYYGLKTCGLYRTTSKEFNEPTIWIMIDKCANRGHSGRMWSWPSYAVDRTPYGVLAHEMGHHVDHCMSNNKAESFKEGLFSYKVYQYSKEKPLTGYLGTDELEYTFYTEWFAENMRLFITNPDLCHKLRPRFFDYLTKECQQKFLEVTIQDWKTRLEQFDAPERIVLQAQKKILGIKK